MNTPCLLSPSRSDALRPLVFAYSICFPDGKLYTGRVSHAARPDYDRSTSVSDAFTYSEAGAYAKIARLSAYFAGATVQRVID